MAPGAVPAVVRRGTGARKRRPLVLLLHGHGVDERDIAPLADLFPADATVAAPRAPLPSEDGFAWYVVRDGQPDAASLEAGVAYVENWLVANRGDANVIVLVGFSGGAVLAGALALRTPERYAGVAMLHGPLPFVREAPPKPDALARCAIFFGYGQRDRAIATELVARTTAYLREESGADALIRGYPSAHAIPPAEERDLARWYASLP